MRRQHLTQLIGTLVVAAALVALPTAAFAQGISGTSHDLSAGAGGGEICVVCHVPHDALAVAEAPLWNHTATVASFTMYDSLTMDAADPAGPGGISLLCLSCHDGSVALDALGGAAGAGGSIPAASQVGTDLSYDHPISIDYNSGDTGLNADSTVVPALGGATIAVGMLFGGDVECASCHDPHDATNPPFLVMANTGSALCLTCHNK
jgi:predicted CXXCH cytochrome family protein